MTKRELIWLLIRLAGLYFLVTGILMALDAVNFLAVPLLYDQQGLLFRNVIGSHLGTLIGSLFFSALGLYLLYRGGAVFSVLNRQPVE